MLEFVSSLKYYSKIWPRANLFSKIANLLGVSVLPGSIDSSQLNQYDIHTQKFFLWMFKQIMKHQEEIKEVSEGQSVIHRRKAVSIFEEELGFFLNPKEKIRVKMSLEKESKQYKIDTGMVDGIDIDVMMNALVYEFVQQRKKRLKLLRISYGKNYKIERGKRKPPYH